MTEFHQSISSIQTFPLASLNSAACFITLHVPCAPWQHTTLLAWMSPVTTRPASAGSSTWNKRIDRSRIDTQSLTHVYKDLSPRPVTICDYNGIDFFVIFQKQAASARPVSAAMIHRPNKNPDLNLLQSWVKWRDFFSCEDICPPQLNCCLYRWDEVSVTRRAFRAPHVPPAEAHLKGEAVWLYQ